MILSCDKRFVNYTISLFTDIAKKDKRIGYAMEHAIYNDNTITMYYPLFLFVKLKLLFEISVIAGDIQIGVKSGNIGFINISNIIRTKICEYIERISDKLNKFSLVRYDSSKSCVHLYGIYVKSLYMVNNMILIEWLYTNG